jgi:hypothetical protein
MGPSYSPESRRPAGGRICGSTQPGPGSGVRVAAADMFLITWDMQVAGISVLAILSRGSHN